MNAILHHADSSLLSSAPSSPAPVHCHPLMRPPPNYDLSQDQAAHGARQKNVLSQVKRKLVLLFSQNLTLHYNEQKLEDVKNQMVTKFPIFDNYKNMWPLDIIIISLLKYYLAHGKDAFMKNVVNNMQEVISPASISSCTHHSKAI
ncbi:hypothetical protein Hypma_005711 [Hypsizygus marmoreus]|uniref:Uncharacterized protein n=1 Tax=Hypsizygus marmoreus TaxID=39966 RepID=A0A369KCR2_HYPMA|nr:hypothetical protein Hypma_005711 [Hypsizygus marmoreus]